MNEAQINNLTGDELLQYAPREDSPWMAKLCEALDEATRLQQAEDSELRDLKTEVEYLKDEKKRLEEATREAAYLIENELAALTDRDALEDVCREALGKLQWA